jgi:hypothetical protein
MSNENSSQPYKTSIVLVMLPVILLILSGILTTWIWKLDDRQFASQSEIVTRQELHNSLEGLEERITTRFDSSDKKVEKLFDLLREQERTK